MTHSKMSKAFVPVKRHGRCRNNHFDPDMEKGGYNFHCVKCKIAYMSFDQMYEHIKKFHVDDLLSGLSRLETAQQIEPKEPDIISEDEEKKTGELMDVEVHKSPDTDRMAKLIAQRRNHAEILRRHFFGEKSVKGLKEKHKSDGKSCLEELLLGKKEDSKTKPMDVDGQKTFRDLLTMPSTSTETEPPTPTSVEIKTPVTEVQISDAEDEKLVILQISQMENLLTNNLLQLYEQEAEDMAARPKTPKPILSETSVEFNEEALKISHDDLKITDKTEGEGESEVPQVRTRGSGVGKDVSEEKMEIEQQFTISVSGIHPKYKHRKLNELDADKIRRHKVVTLSSATTDQRSVPSTSKQEEKSIYVPKPKKEVEYDSEEDCYFYVEHEVTKKDPGMEKRDEEIRAILDDKFGDIGSIRVDPYFEYLWKQSFDIKDALWDTSTMTGASKSHAWSNPRLQ